MYNKLFTKILDSSIWLEPLATRIVWVTFIAAMDEKGFCAFAAVGNVATRARVSLHDTKRALHTLENPDKESSDKAKEGRRIERVPGGWMVLNAEKYRNLVTRADQQANTRERVRRFRERKKSCNAQCNADVTSSEAYTDTHTNTESEREDSGVCVSSGPPPEPAPTEPHTHALFDESFFEDKP